MLADWKSPIAEAAAKANELGSALNIE